MRKWRPPGVSAEDEWTVNHQIVVPKAYRPEILNFAKENIRLFQKLIDSLFLHLMNHFIELSVTA